MSGTSHGRSWVERRVMAAWCAALMAVTTVVAPAGAITGGDAVEPGSWPNLVALVRSDIWCTGTLIHHRWILTAAHCAYDGDSEVGTVWAYIGREHLAFEGDGESTKIERRIVHPSFGPPDGSPGQPDIALFELQVNWQGGVANALPMRLPRADQGHLNDPGASVLVAGYGTTCTGCSTSQQAREVDLPVREASACGARSGEFCAGQLSSEGDLGGDTCGGDSCSSDEHAASTRRSFSSSDTALADVKTCRSLTTSASAASCSCRETASGTELSDTDPR